MESMAGGYGLQNLMKQVTSYFANMKCNCWLPSSVTIWVSLEVPEALSSLPFWAEAIWVLPMEHRFSVCISILAYHVIVTHHCRSANTQMNWPHFAFTIGVWFGFAYLDRVGNPAHQCECIICSYQDRALGWYLAHMSLTQGTQLLIQ